MSAYVHDTQFFTRRTIVLFVIIGLHIFIAWALATGLARRAIELVAPPVKVDMIEEVQKRDEPPPPPPPQLERPPVEIPPPDVTIDVPVENTTAIADVTTVHQPAPPPVIAPKAVNRVGPRPGKGFPNSEDFYPPASKRLGESGSVNVKACVGPNGKLTEEPSVAQSSGSARLDEGALKLAKAASGHYQPGTEDGQPSTQCFVFRLTFVLKN
jgi:protein TonB